MLVPVVNQQYLRGGQRTPLREIRRVFHAVSRHERVQGSHEVSVAFVSPSRMRTLNRTYRGKDAGTDVLAFEIGEDGVLGEIVLSYEQARRQAESVGHSTRTEVLFLLTHGLLHLLGYDHEASKAKATIMFKKQEAILKQLGINPEL